MLKSTLKKEIDHLLLEYNMPIELQNKLIVENKLVLPAYDIAPCKKIFKGYNSIHNMKIKSNLRRRQCRVI